MPQEGALSVTYRHGVDEEGYKDDEKDEDNGRDEVPLVVLPDDVLEGLPGGREPQE